MSATDDSKVKNLMTIRMQEIWGGLQNGGVLGDTGISGSSNLVIRDGDLLRTCMWPAPLTWEEVSRFRVDTLMQSLQTPSIVITACGTRVYVIHVGFQALLYTLGPVGAIHSSCDESVSVTINRAAKLWIDNVLDRLKEEYSHYCIVRTEIFSQCSYPVRDTYYEDCAEYRKKFNLNCKTKDHTDLFWPTDIRSYVECREDFSANKLAEDIVEGRRRTNWLTPSAPAQRMYYTLKDWTRYALTLFWAYTES